MKIVKNILALCFIGLYSLLSAQVDYDYKDYTWEASPKTPELSKEDKELSEIVLKELLVYEYVVIPGAGAVRYKTFHKAILVSDDKGIEGNNKVYVPVSDDKDIEVLKARTISPSGNITELKDEKFKEVEDLEDYGSFKIFALEGIEKGSVIEYYYTIKDADPSIKGSIFIQKSVKILDYKFELITPEHLIFKVIGVNGVVGIQDTLTEDEKNYISYETKNVEKYESEKYAAKDANKQRLDYNFTEIVYQNGTTKNSNQDWAAAATTFQRIYSTFDSKTLKKFTKSLKTIGVTSSMSTEDKVKKIENYVKDQHNFQFDDKIGNRELADVFETKRVGEADITKMFCHYFKAAGVNYNLVLTSDRFDKRFEKDNENWTYLQELILYIPELDIYIGPSEIQNRYGLVAATLTENYGLFINEVEITKDVTSATPEVKWIKGTKLEDNASIMDLDISFDDFSAPKVTLVDKYKGHEGSFFKFQVTYGDEEQLEEMYKSLLKSKLGEDAELENVKSKGKNINISSIEEPFEISGEATVPSIIETAGEEYLFKIGNVIGEQVQMYQEKERKYNAEVRFPHYYQRNITFTVPEGYKVSGLEDLNIDITYGDETGNTIGFVSKYKVEGNKVSVDVYEYYKNTVYPMEQFEDFRKVVNAAADFNKIVILFSKK